MKGERYRKKDGDVERESIGDTWYYTTPLNSKHTFRHTPTAGVVYLVFPQKQLLRTITGHGGHGHNN